jgi:opacity protein-like surface antigen
MGRWAFLLLCLLPFIGQPAFAQDSEGGFYLGVRAIGSFVSVDDVNTSGFTGSTGTQNDTDTVAGVGGVVGYRWEDVPLRTELEGGYRFRFDFDLQDQGAPVVDYEANIETASVLFNALLEWRNESDFTPFIGGSLGWARNTSETTRVVIPGGATVTQDNDEDNLAWGVMAGVDWEFIDHWSAGLAYRYLDLGEVDVGSFSGGDSVSADDFTSHDVLLTVSYRF